MQLNTLDVIRYFGAKTKITSWSLISCMTLECNIVENMFWIANKTLNLAIFCNIQSHLNSKFTPTAGPSDSFQGKHFQRTPRFLWEISRRNKQALQKVAKNCQSLPRHWQWHLVSNDIPTLGHSVLQITLLERLKRHHISDELTCFKEMKNFNFNQYWICQVKAFFVSSVQWHDPKRKHQNSFG